MKKKCMYFILPVITLILEILPYGAVCNFANPEGEPWKETFSYFSLTPFGYANAGPFITACITCIVFVMLVIYCITGKQRVLNAVKILLYVSVATSLMPLMFGISYFSVAGTLITACLFIELLLIHYSLRKVIE